MSDLLSRLTSLSAQKMVDAAQASADKRAALLGVSTPEDTRVSQIAMETGRGTDLVNPAVRDAMTMDYFTLSQKYGAQAALDLQNQTANMRFKRSQMRSNQDAAQGRSDDAAAIIGSALKIFTDIPATVTGIAAKAGALPNAVPEFFLKGSQAITDTVEDNQSNFRRFGLEEKAIKDQLTQHDNEKLRKAAVAEGSGNFMAKVAREGRNIIDSAINLTENDQAFSDGVAQAIGSFASGALLGKLASKIMAKGAGVAAGTQLSTGAQRTAETLMQRYGAAALGITTQESSAAYAGAAIEVLGMDEAALRENSQKYNEMRAANPLMTHEEARLELANTAGLISAAITAPTALLASRFSSKLVANPLGRGPGGVASGAFGEGSEEAVIGLGGTMGHNFALGQTADNNRDIAQGVGQGIAEGGILGGVIGGGMRVPAVAASAASTATLATLDLAAAGIRKVYARGKAITDTAMTKVAPAFNDLRNSMAETVQTFAEGLDSLKEDMIANVDAAGMAKRMNEEKITPENDASTVFTDEDIVNPEVRPETLQNQANSYADRLFRDLNAVPDEMLEMVGSQPLIFNNVKNATNILETVEGLVKSINETDPGSAEGQIAALTLYEMRENVSNTLASRPELMEDLDVNHPIRKAESLLFSVVNSKELGDTFRTLEATVGRPLEGIDRISDAEIQTPEGQAKARTVLMQSFVNPGSVNPKLMNSVMGHVNKGAVPGVSTKVAEFGRAVEGLAQANAKYRAGLEKAGIKGASLASLEVIGDEKNWGSATKPTMFGHVRRVVNAVNEGNNEAAISAMRHLWQFTKSQNNKVAALNAHIASDSWDEKGAVKYRALQPSRTFQQTTKGVYFNPTSEASIRLAKQTAFEAQALADVFNHLAQQFPDINIPQFTPVQLDERAAGPIKEVQKRFAELREQMENSNSESNSAPGGNAGNSTGDPKPPENKPPENGEEGQGGQPAGNNSKPTTPPGDGQESAGTPPPAAPTKPKQVVTEDTVEPVSPDMAEQDFIDGLYENEEFGFVNTVKTMFKRPGGKSTLTGAANPLMVWSRMMDVSSKAGGRQAKEVHKSYRQMVGQFVPNFVETMQRRAWEYANKPANKKYIQEAKARGLTPLNMKREGRILNFMEVKDGQLVLNTQVAQITALATLHWILQGNSGNIQTDLEEMAQDMGMTETELMAPEFAEMRKWLASGQTENIAATDLSRTIQNFLGLVPDKDARQQDTLGTIGALAVEAMAIVREGNNNINGETGVGLLTVSTLAYDPVTYKVYSPDQISKLPKDSNVVVIDRIGFDHSSFFREVEINNGGALIEVASPALQDRSLIARLINTDFRPEVSIGEPNLDNIPKTANNSPETELSNDQVKALRREAAVPFNVDGNIFRAFAALKINQFQKYFGSGYTSEELDNLNQGHRILVEGQNVSTETFYNEFISLMGGVLRYAQDAGQDFKDVPLFYNYTFTRNARMQMLGRANPQGDKLMRALVGPTRATLDMTTEEHSRGFNLAVAQALGVKVHKQGFRSNMNALRKEISKHREGINLLKGWLKKDDDSLMPVEVLESLKNSFGVRQTGSGNPYIPAVGFQHLIEWARFENAREAGTLKEFPTPAYLELDGITNGVANTIVKFMGANFGQAELDNLRRAGLFLNADTDMGGFKEESGRGLLDFYELSGTYAAKSMMTDDRVFADKTSAGLAKQHINSLLSLFNMFANGVLSTEFDTDGEISKIEAKRNLMKLPMTQANYGAGVGAVSASLSDMLMTAVYERMSAAQLRMSQNKGMSLSEAMFGEEYGSQHGQAFAFFQNALGTVLSTDFVQERDRETGEEKGLRVFQNKKLDTAINNIDPLKFTVGSRDLVRLKRGIQRTIGMDVVYGINEAIGLGTVRATETVKMLTNAMGTLYAEAFVVEYNKKLNELREADKNIVTLTPNEIQAILDNVAPLAPMVDAGRQKFWIVKNKIDTTNRMNYATDTSRTVNVKGAERIPMAPGVAGMPYLVIGTGDGYMMLDLSARGATLKALKVFDGMNTAVDKLNDYGPKANEGVLNSWKVNTPLDIVRSFNANRETFLRYAAQMDTDNGSIQTAEMRKVMNFFKGSAVEATIEQINMGMADMLELAVDAETNIRALARMPLSVDQMAGAAKQFFQEGEGEIDPTLSDEDLIETFNAIRAEVREEARGHVLKEVGAKLADSIDAADKSKLFPPMVRYGRELKSGVRSLSRSALQNVLKEAVKSGEWGSEHQLTVLRDILKSSTIDDYTIYYGNPDQLLKQAWEIDAPVEVRNAFLESRNKGLADITSKTIFINSVNNTPMETLVHELIHAATMERVQASLEGTLTGDHAAVVNSAVADLKKLAEEYMTQFGEPGSSSEMHFNVLWQMRQARDRFGDAAMINEFMAWVLSNNTLANNAAEDTETVRQSGITRWVKAALASIKKLIWGRKHMPKPADDLLSQVRFNTNIIMRAEVSLAQELRDGALLYQSYADTQHERRVDDMVSVLTQSMSDVINDPDNEFMYPGDASPIRRKSAEIVGRFTKAGFKFEGAELEAFILTVDALALGRAFDPAMLSRAQDMLNMVAKKLSPNSFLVDPDTATQADIEQAHEKYNLIIGRKNAVKDPEGISLALPAFVALGATNKEFQDLLKTLEFDTKEQKIVGKNVDETLTNVGRLTMSKLSDYLSGSGKKATNVSDAVKSIVDNMLHYNTKKVGLAQRSEDKVSSAMAKANKVVADAVQRAGKRIAEKGEKFNGLPNHKRLQGSIKLGLTALGAALDKESADDAAEFAVAMANQREAGSQLTALVTEFMGRTNINAGVFDLIKLAHSLVEQARQKYREHTPANIKKHFSVDVSDSQWANMHKNMAASDLASVAKLSGVSLDDALDVLVDGPKRGAMMKTIEDRLKISAVGGASWSEVNDRMHALAEYMHTGDTKFFDLRRNAHAIARLGNAQDGYVSVPQATLDDIDALVTLRLIGKMSLAESAELKDLIKNDREGVKTVLAFLRGVRKVEEAKPVSEGMKLNAYKGFVPSEAVDDTSLVIAPVSHRARLEMTGFVMLDTYKGPAIGNWGNGDVAYFISTVGGKARFAQGISQNVRNTYFGIDTDTGRSVWKDTAGMITDRKLVNAIRTSSAVRNYVGQEQLIPVFGHNGEIYAYERSVRADMSNRVPRAKNLADMIGAWRGRQDEESKALAVNRALVDRLKEMYDKDLAKRGKGSTTTDDYVDILNKEFLDSNPRIKEAVDLMPTYTKQYAAEVFGGSFYVRKEMLNDAIGYRKNSIGSSWHTPEAVNRGEYNQFATLATGIFGKNAYKYLTEAEGFWQDRVNDARYLIVVKSMIIPALNFMSAMLQNVVNGVPPSAIIRGVPRALDQIRTYVNTTERLNAIEVELSAFDGQSPKRTALQAEARNLNAMLRRLPIWPLIDAGEFTAITDVDLAKADMALAQGRFDKFVQKMVDKMPPKMFAVARQAYITKDTALGQGLQRAVDYGDFIAKVIYYDHLTGKEGKSKDEALGLITEEFVHFNRLPGRLRHQLEDNGLLWFWKPKIRFTKIALRMMRDKPLYSALYMGVPGVDVISAGAGIAIDENIITKALDGNIGYTMGPGMLFNAPNLHPLVNMTS